jgi:hypothetical protein
LARTTGFPTSSNKASSFHAWWGPERAGVVEVEVTLTVTAVPVVDHLYFWAVQVGFAGRLGGRHGAGHLGLMWNPRHPGHGAVNWGGYDPSGRVHDGIPAGLPSATANQNTFDFEWHPGRPYRLRVRQADQGWEGSVIDADGVTTVVRTMLAGGQRLTGVGVWSEIFARCDDPPAAVTWSEPRQRDAAGFDHRPEQVRLTYQEEGRGGCDNTATTVAGGILVQTTNTSRPNRAGDVLAW